MRELVLGQVKINKNINKKLLANDKSLKRLNDKLETLSSTLKNQLSFNKIKETQLAQIVAFVLVSESGKIPGQPESPVETTNMVSTGWGNLLLQTFRTNHAGRYNPPKNDEGQALWGAPESQPEVPTTTRSKRGRAKKVWHKVASSSSSNSPRRAEQW